MAETCFVTGGSGFIGGKLVRRLVGEGHTVRALARSDAAARKVAALGAEPVRGDLADPVALAAAADGASVAFHLAAHLGEWEPWEDFERGNVVGTRNALAACEEAGVRRFVHCGTEAALMAGEPLVHVDETAPLRPDSRAPYPATKAKAELAARARPTSSPTAIRSSSASSSANCCVRRKSSPPTATCPPGAPRRWRESAKRPGSYFPSPASRR